jgi:hypothetical protein
MSEVRLVNEYIFSRLGAKDNRKKEIVVIETERRHKCEKSYP